MNTDPRNPPAASGPSPGQRVPVDDIAPGDQARPGTPGTGETMCPACNGSGRSASGQPCPDCLGSGKITAGIGGA